jgi:hypothetical protein
MAVSAWVVVFIALLMRVGAADDAKTSIFIDTVAPSSGPLGLELSPQLKVVNIVPNAQVKHIELGDELVAINKQVGMSTVVNHSKN